MAVTMDKLLRYIRSLRAFSDVRRDLLKIALTEREFRKNKFL